MRGEGAGGEGEGCLWEEAKGGGETVARGEEGEKKGKGKKAEKYHKRSGDRLGQRRGEQTVERERMLIVCVRLVDIHVHSSKMLRRDRSQTVVLLFPFPSFLVSRY